MNPVYSSQQADMSAASHVGMRMSYTCMLLWKVMHMLLSKLPLDMPALTFSPTNLSTSCTQGYASDASHFDLLRSCRKPAVDMVPL
jgi:hypothetical protein